MRILRYDADGRFPGEALAQFVYGSEHQRGRTRVAIMADEVPDDLPRLDAGKLDPEEDYQWSGYLVQRKVKKLAKRVMIGSYEQWFRWYMGFLRFRAFHCIVLIEPFTAVTDGGYGGYVDGMLARLMSKVSQVAVVTRGGSAPVVADKERVDAVLRALLYGTRLSKPEILNQAERTFVPLSHAMVEEELATRHWRISRKHPRYRLNELDEELLQGMVSRPPAGYMFGKQDQVEQHFKREQKFRRELSIPDEMLKERVVQDVAEKEWVTVPYEWGRISSWLDELNRAGDSRLERIVRGQEYLSDRQWMALLSPPKWQIRRVLEGLAAEGKLEVRPWFKEAGRPAFAYHVPSHPPFLESRCGQCAFYVSPKRRCRLWWLANKRRVFFHPAWKQPGSTVTGFELHKMTWASRTGPHSSACWRFIDKKRDHNRKEIPTNCEICGSGLHPRQDGKVTKCSNCGTKYLRFGSGVKVATAYEHEYNRIYYELTGSVAEADLQEYQRGVRERLALILQQKADTEDLDELAEESEEEELGFWRRPHFSQELQRRVDEIAASTDIARKFSLAMAESARNATERIIAIAKLDASNASRALALQERYAILTATAEPSELLTYEGLIMKEYWRCFGAAISLAQQWFGPRKRSRFVREFIEDPSGKAKGYSPFDAAINYLHQRRLRIAEKVDEQVGFPGTSDGFLHRKKHNSRGIGLLLDMIDPFKFADREVLLAVVLNGGLSWKDFALEKDRRGATFYYPSLSGRMKLEQIGRDADETTVVYGNRQMSLSEGYAEQASSLLKHLEDGSQLAYHIAFTYVTAEV